MDGWEYLDDDACFLMEEEVPLEYREAPKLLSCPHAPFGKMVMRCCPLSPEEAHKMVTRIQNDEAVHCGLFALAKNAYNMDASDVAQWVESCAKISKKPISPHDVGKACLCGQMPKCKKGSGFSEAENTDAVHEMIERYQTLWGSLYLKLPGFDPEKLPIVHAWAVENDPDMTGKAIRVLSLAKRFKCSPGTIYGAINEARQINPYIIGKIEKHRKQGAQITRGGEVRSE